MGDAADIEVDEAAVVEMDVPRVAAVVCETRGRPIRSTLANQL